MDQPKESKPNQIPLIWIVLVVFAFFYCIGYILGRHNEVKDLKAKLKAQKDALESLNQDIEESKKLLAKLQKTIRNYTLVLKLSVAVVFSLVNWWYIRTYYPADLSVRDICEGIGSCTGFLAISSSALLFIRYGNIIDLKTAYRSFQIWVLAIRFQKKEEVIEALIRIRIISRHELVKEIEALQKAITEIEDELRAYMPADTPALTTPGFPIPPPVIIPKEDPKV